jgi:hypothetical protein
VAPTSSRLIGAVVKQTVLVAVYGGANAPCRPRFLVAQEPGFPFYLQPHRSIVKAGRIIC